MLAGELAQNTQHFSSNWSSQQLLKTKELIEQVQLGLIKNAVVRAYQPLPTAAFSRRETFLPGFANAVEVAQQVGYAPAIRLTGGRCVVYDQNSVVLDVVFSETNRKKTSEEHFIAFADWFVNHLQQFGLDARVGQLDGEYCPGPYSVNASGEIKIVGVAQRVLIGARLISSVIQISDAEKPRWAMTEINQAMGFAWRSETFGAVEDKSVMFYNSDFRESLALAAADFVNEYSGGLEVDIFRS